MKEEKNIDQLFKEGLQQDFPFDSSLWANVEGQLPGSATRRPLWYFNLNSIVLITVLLSCAFIQSDTVISTKVAVQTISQNSNLKSGTSASASKKEKKEKTSEAKAALASAPALAAVTPNNSNKTINSKSAKSNKNQNAFTSNDQSGNEKGIESNTGTKRSEPAKSQINNALSSSNNANPKTADFKPNKKISELKIQRKSSSKTVANQFAFAKNEELRAVHSFGYYFPLYTALIPEARSSDLGKLNGIQSKYKKRIYYVELEASRSLNLSKTVESNNSAFKTEKENSERSLHAENLGINILTPYKSFELGVGIHWNRFYENVSYTVDKMTQGYDISFDTNYRIINPNFNSGGHNVLLIKQEINEVRTAKTIIVDDQLMVQNEFKRIRIPLSVGYKKALGSFSLGLRTAFVLNYLYEQNGVYIDEDLNSIKNLREGNQFNTFVYGHQTGIGLGYSLNEFVAVGCRFSYEYDLNSFTKDYNSKFQHQNLGLWLLWKPN